MSSPALTYWSGSEPVQLYLDVSAPVHPSGLPQRELTVSFLSAEKQIVSCRLQHGVAHGGTGDPTYS